MLLCKSPPSQSKLGPSPLFDEIISQGSLKEKRSVVDLVSNVNEVHCLLVQNVNEKMGGVEIFT